MELVAYIVMVIGAYVALILRRSGIVYGWFILFIIYSLIARLSQPTGDMLVYYEAAEVWPPSSTFYRLREPVLWFGSSLLYQLVADRVMTFLLIDILSGIIVLRAMKKLDNGDDGMFSFAPTIISSYVFLLGQQNVFRQHLAFAILLWALVARSRNQRVAFSLFVLSVLTHNATAVLFGYWIDVGRAGQRRRYGPVVTLVGVILIGTLLPFIRKSSSATGVDTAYLYLVLACVFMGLLLYANAGRVSSSWSAALFNFIAFTPAISILASAQFERLSMMFLVLVLIDTYRYHLPLRLGGVEAAHLGYGILVIPVFLFPSALGMLW